MTSWGRPCQHAFLFMHSNMSLVGKHIWHFAAFSITFLQGFSPLMRSLSAPPFLFLSSLSPALSFYFLHTAQPRALHTRTELCHDVYMHAANHVWWQAEIITVKRGPDGLQVWVTCGFLFGLLGNSPGAPNGQSRPETEDNTQITILTETLPLCETTTDC